jgi:hypothetical protein
MRLIKLLFLAAVLALAAPAAAAPKIAGTYSNLFWHEEAGDLLGIEILIFPSKNGYMALFQVAEGGSPSAILLPAKIEGTRVELKFPKGFHYSEVSFVGRIDEKGLKGSFTGGVTAPTGENAVVLTRGRSYWQ